MVKINDPIKAGRCLVCGSPNIPLYRIGLRRFRGGHLCSAKCNNQMMVRLINQRENQVNNYGKGRAHFWFDWQRLPENGWLGSRCWFHWGTHSFNNSTDWVLRFEIATLKRAFELGLGIGIEIEDINSEDTFKGHIHTGMVSLYCGLETPWHWKKWINNLKIFGVSLIGEKGRSLRVDWINDSILIKLWHDNERGSGTGYWIYPKDWLLGKEISSKKIVESGKVQLSMPEGGYGCKYELIKYHFKRPRWFGWNQYVISIDVVDDAGIPINGKGDDAWNCGPDSVHGFSCWLDRKEILIGVVVGLTRMRESIEETRRKYGIPPAEEFTKRGMAILSDK